MQDVHLHLVVGESGLNRLAALAHCLDAHERARCERFRFERDRVLYRAAHVLLRHALSRQAPVPPADWRFVGGPSGRPEIDTDACPAGAGLRFNLSHTEGLVCCALTRDASVGIDTERHRVLADLGNLSRQVFSLEENRALERMSAETRAAGFYAFWTLKEAYLKAIGTGLNAELRRFGFHLEGDPPSTVVLRPDPDSGQRAGDWRFLLLRVAEAHSLAVAVRAPAGVRFNLRAGEIGEYRLLARSEGCRIALGESD